MKTYKTLTFGTFRTFITNINIKSTDSSITDTSGTRPTTDVNFLCVNRFDNCRVKITNKVNGGKLLSLKENSAAFS